VAVHAVAGRLVIGVLPVAREAERASMRLLGEGLGCVAAGAGAGYVGGPRVRGFGRDHMAARAVRGRVVVFPVAGCALGDASAEREALGMTIDTSDLTVLLMNERELPPLRREACNAECLCRDVHAPGCSRQVVTIRAGSPLLGRMVAGHAIARY
jgi:hypothetical protein